MNGDDRLIQGMAWNAGFRIIAAQTSQAVETAREIWDLSPVAAAVLGRAMTGAVLLARLLDKQVRNQHVTLRFEGSGPLGVVIAEGNVRGNIRGYVSDPSVDGDLKNLGRAIGADGSLTVIRGVPPSGTPYTSQVRLVTGDVARDIAHYLAASEQVHSAVLLGVLNKRSGVATAGGMIVQAFPGAGEKAIEEMESRMRNAPSLSTLLDTMPIEDAVQEILHGVDYKAIDSSFDIPIEYACQCTRERALAQFAIFSRQELGEMIYKEGGSVATCQFCGRRYDFTSDDLLLVEGDAADS